MNSDLKDQMNELLGDIALDEAGGRAVVEPVWLTDDQLIHINQRVVGTMGESHGIADLDSLVDGLARPKREWAQGDYDVADLAGLLLLEIGKQHPFEQGNKRTALAAANVFLEFNGYSLVAPDVEPLAQLVDGAISGAIPEERFLKAMRASAIPTAEWLAYQGAAGVAPV